MMVELLSFMTLIKMAIAILMTLLLSILAEVISPRFAGILSGYPLGAAITLFFIGLEIGPGFAAESALHTSAGLVATQVFAYSYYRASLLGKKLNGKLHILIASFTGILGYFGAAFFLSILPVNLAIAILLPFFFILVFIYLFRSVKNVAIHRRVSMNLKVLLIRSMFAAGTIVLITSTARLAGPNWAGLFAAFPITMLPFIVIIHFTYDPEHVYAILKNVPKGLISLIIYSITVYIAYPAYGIYTGTALAYAIATLYLAVTQLELNMRIKS
jgi:hypothetical protein